MKRAHGAVKHSDAGPEGRAGIALAWFVETESVTSYWLSSPPHEENGYNEGNLLIIKNNKAQANILSM